MQTRIISLALVLCLAFSLAIPVGAANIAELEIEPASPTLQTGTTVTLQRISQGKYSLVTNNASQTQTQAQSGSVVQAKSLHDGEMLQLADDTYLGKAEGTNYIQLDRIDVDVENFNRENPIFAEYDISDDTLDNIQESITFAQENDNDLLEISLYAINPNLTDTVTIGNNKYRNTYEEIRNASFRPIESFGTDAKSSLSLAKAFMVTVFSVCSEEVNLVATGLSLLQFIQNQTGLKVGTGTTDDWVYTTMFYDKLVKHTAIERNTTWQEGCVSQKLWINKAAVWAYFRSTNAQDQKVDSRINKTYYTKNWDTCYNVTLYNWATGAIKDSNIQMNYRGITWIFK